MPRQPSTTHRSRPDRPPVVQTENTSRLSQPLFPDPTLPRHFFRIILENIIQAKKLHIPLRLFNKRIGRAAQLSDVATLSVSNGSHWKVKVEKDAEHIWFVDGWSDFVTENGICAQYLLSFKHKGNSCFKVRIFDPTTFEISEYGKKEEKKEKTKQENDKVSKSDATIEISETVLDHTPKTKAHNSKRKKKNNQKKEVKVYTSRLYQRSLAMTSNGSKEADRKADKYKPKYDAIKALLQDNAITRDVLIVPQNFARECMKKVYEKATFKCSDKEEFPVNVAGWGCVGNMAFRGGWAAFSQHLKLKLGDVLILEQTRNGVFEVKVFRS